MDLFLELTLWLDDIFPFNMLGTPIFKCVLLIMSTRQNILLTLIDIEKHYLKYIILLYVISLRVMNHSFSKKKKNIKIINF